MPLTISYTNYSSKEWSRWDWHSENIDWDSRVNQSPRDVLIANSGMTTAKASENSSPGFTMGDMSIRLGFESDGNYVGVECATHVQVFGIGKGTTWSSYDRDGWVKENERADPKTWVFDKFTATATPSLSHQEATIDVVIQDRTS